jgi:hypothetical protein
VTLPVNDCLAVFLAKTVKTGLTFLCGFGASRVVVATVKAELVYAGGALKQGTLRFEQIHVMARTGCVYCCGATENPAADDCYPH